MSLIPYYINLDFRKDRDELIKKEFERLNIENYVRIPAIYNSDDGSIGCLESHIKALEEYNIDSDIIWVCEDDIQFLVDKSEIDRYIKEFIESPADILCLGYNSFKHDNYSNLLLRTTRTQTASSYIIKSKFRKVLLELWKSVLKSRILNVEHPAKKQFKLINYRNDIFEVTDQCWKLLQHDYIFVIPKTRILIQRASYSDIERKNVNYRV